MQRSTQIKTQLAAMLLALVLGALFTVAIAWKAARGIPEFAEPGDAHWSASTGPSWMFRESEVKNGLESATRLEGIAASAWSTSAAGATRFKSPPRRSRFAIPPDDDASINGGNPQMIEEQFGWPLRAMSCAHVSNGGPARWTVIDGIELKPHPQEQFRSVALPLRPIVGGFVVNTLLNAAILWVLLVPVVMLLRRLAGLRRLVRRYRGFCPACGYDLQRQFDRGCSECGWQRPQVPLDTVGHEDVPAR